MNNQNARNGVVNNICTSTSLSAYNNNGTTPQLFEERVQLATKSCKSTSGNQISGCTITNVSIFRHGHLVTQSGYTASFQVQRAAKE